MSNYRRPGDVATRLHPILEGSFAFTLRAASRHVHGHVATELRDVGAGWHNFVILSVALKLGGLSQQGLAERTGVDRTRVSEIVADLEYEGLVERRPAPHDLRRSQVFATGDAQGWMADASAAVRRAEDEALRPLRDSERTQLHGLLVRLLPIHPDPIWAVR